MRNSKEKTQFVRLKNGQLVEFSSGIGYDKLNAEQETALLFDIAKAMQLSVSEEEIRAAVDHFKEKESSAER
jgi:hypothetical protein